MKIAVYGSASGELLKSDETKQKGRIIGREIARRGHIVVTGGCIGFPHEAVLGANSVGGECIGYSPARDLSDHLERFGFPIEGFTELKYLDERFVYEDTKNWRFKQRNMFSIYAVDAVVTVGGGFGTMNEFTLAYSFGKNVGVLLETGGISKRAIQVMIEDAAKPNGPQVIFDPDPVSLVERLVDLEK